MKVVRELCAWVEATAKDKRLTIQFTFEQQMRNYAKHSSPEALTTE